MNRFDDDFYIFAAPKDDPESNSHIKVMDGSLAGLTFVVNWIKLRKKHFGVFGPYILKYHYSVVDMPSHPPPDSGELNTLVGQIIEDVWEKYY